jgi:GxxExxY protein
MTENEISKIIVDCAFKVHTKLGPGLFEAVYEAAMAHELMKQDLRVERQVLIPITYDGVVLGDAFRADMIVEDMVIIELKSIEQVQPVHSKQLLTYLRLTNKRLGLLINFNVNMIRSGIQRIVNGLPE